MIISLLFLSVILGALLGEIVTRSLAWKKSFLTFSGAYLLGIVILEIFPHYFGNNVGGHSNDLGLFVIIGVVLQILLEGLSRGAEHGHFHAEDKNRIPIGIFIGLLIHAFIEGIPTQEEVGTTFTLAVFIHKIPVSAFLYTFLKPLKFHKRFIYIFLFALAAPVGNYLGQYLSTQMINVFLGLTAGIFLHISSVIIFESADNHKIKFYKLVSLLMGILLAYLSVELLHH